MLTKNITATREIPNEPGQQMTFRQLGWRQLTEATEVKAAAGIRSLKDMGSDVFREMQAMNQTEQQLLLAAARAADPLNTYDQATVLRAGIAAWSYPDKVTPENIDSLDPETAKWAALEIINLGKPPAEKEVEEDFFGSQSSSMASPATQTVAVSAMLGSTPNGSSG